MIKAAKMIPSGIQTQQRARTCPKNVLKDVPIDQTLLEKGKLITDIRNSDCTFQAVRDRLCLWSTGDEIISLLMMLKSDQITESYRAVVHNTSGSMTPQITVDDGTSIIHSESNRNPSVYHKHKRSTDYSVVSTTDVTTTHDFLGVNKLPVPGSRSRTSISRTSSPAVIPGSTRASHVKRRSSFHTGKPSKTTSVLHAVVKSNQVALKPISEHV